MLVALALGAATLVLIVKESSAPRPPVRVSLPSRLSPPEVALATLQTVYLRGEITHVD